MDRGVKTLPPMIQDMQLVVHWNVGCQQVHNSLDNAARGEVALPIIIQPNNKDAGVMSLRFENQIVKQLEILVVSRE